MDVVHDRAAGMDISKRDAKVCVRIPGSRAGTFSKTVTTYGATTNEILRLRHDLEVAAVTIVVMEATGDYWKPFFFLLAESLNVELVNAKQARNIPGRKTDVSDAMWLAELAAHNLLRASFVPPETIRQLRDLTRTRSNLVYERTREYAGWKKGWRAPTSNCPPWPAPCTPSPHAGSSMPSLRANVTPTLSRRWRTHR